MLKDRIVGWYDAWRRKDPAVTSTVVFIVILVVSFVIAYFSMQGIEDYDSPDIPEMSQPSQSP